MGVYFLEKNLVSFTKSLVIPQKGAYKWGLATGQGS